MSLEHHFVCPLPNGIHARPASSLEEISRGFSSELILLNQRTGHAANGKSVLAIISADIRYNDQCILKISGPDEQEAMAAMSAFVKDTLLHCDDQTPAILTSNGKGHLPLGLRDTSVTVHEGTSVVPGIAQGRIVQVGGFKIPPALPTGGVTDPDTEWRTLDEALKKLIVAYDGRLTAARKKIEIELIKAHRSIARDLEFRHQLHDAVFLRRRTSAGAVADAESHFSTVLTNTGNALLRERALDVKDICFQLLHQIYGNIIDATETQLTADTIVIAESLTPSQFLALNRKFLKGLVLAQGGSTSHTIILARSLGIPTLIGVHDLVNVQLDGQEAVVDADAGLLMTNLTDAARRYYSLEQRRLMDRQSHILKFAAQPAKTQDGHRIEVAVNIASAEEAAAVFAGGAESVGLFRTEMLFLDRQSAPDEAEQFEAYGRVLTAAENRPVIIRTLDVGGDKRLAYLDLPAEENPFLGYRAVRIYPEFEMLFRTQIRALIRASARGKLKLMIPMIATLDEVRWAKKIIAEEQKRCEVDGLPFDANMEIGAMIEVPAAALGMHALVSELDFFSIGSNDLLQYFMAVDRGNARVANLYNPLQPAFLRLLKQIVEVSQAHKKWIGLCGEMASDQRLLPLLVGLGINEISATSAVLAELKAGLRQLTLAACRQLYLAAMNCATAGEVSALLENFSAQQSAPLLSPELIVFDVAATTKEDAIKQAVDLLYIQGRTRQSRAVEEAVLEREATYSTGFGHGFAIPHCKTNAMQSNSLVLMKLHAPVAWGSLDDKPVRMVILLAMRETDCTNEHMKVFAKLARQVMHEEFRASLEQGPDGATLCAFLKEKIEAVS
jgi:phosphoenolpyruvate-protein phosphotransferase